MTDSKPSALQLSMFSCLSDNYGYLLHDAASGETVVIDTPDADTILNEAKYCGWKITQIWNTHWHPDHAGGNQAIKKATGCHIRAPQEVADRLQAPVDEVMQGGQHFKLGGHDVTVIDVPGHTLGHIAYHLPASNIVFVGDALFALGCGRMFEGQPDMFWESLKRLRDLPDDTLVYCAHEYTKANLAFAQSVDPDNPHLKIYGKEILEKRAQDMPTLPARLGREKLANPFLRADQDDMQALMNLPGDAVGAFAALRKAKDNF